MTPKPRTTPTYQWDTKRGKTKWKKTKGFSLVGRLFTYGRPVTVFGRKWSANSAIQRQAGCMNVSARRIALRLILVTVSLLLSTGARAQPFTRCGLDPRNDIVVPAKTHDAADTEKHAYRLKDGSLVFLGMLTIDADGDPSAYGPNGIGLDNLANAGRPGNWWGLATDASDCGPAGRPIIQGPDEEAPGFYVSMTGLFNPAVDDCRRQRNYVNSGAIPYVALPRSLGSIRGNRGKLVVIQKTGSSQPTFAIQADQAPSYGIGEGSIELARKLGLSSNPRTGGTRSRDYVYLVLHESMRFPNSSSELESDVAAAFSRWGGLNRLRSCEHDLMLLPK